MTAAEHSMGCTHWTIPKMLEDLPFLEVAQLLKHTKAKHILKFDSYSARIWRNEDQDFFTCHSDWVETSTLQ